MAKSDFSNPKKHPGQSDLRQRLGASFGPLDVVLRSLDGETKPVAPEWKFSKSSGWYLVYNQGKKRLFYLFPKSGDFLLKMVFNDRCLEEIRGGAFPPFVGKMLEAARKYPEGTLFEFTRESFEPETMQRLLRIKIRG